MTVLLPDRHAADHWQRFGACIDHPDPDLWFLERGRGGYDTARAVCHDCPVRVPCLIQGIKSEGVDATASQRYGMWGGTTPAERQRVMRALREEPMAAWAPVAVDLLAKLDAGTL